MLNYLRHRAFVTAEAARLVVALDAAASLRAGRAREAGIERALAQTLEALGERDLGWMAQSSLANEVRWGLLDRGHAAAWVEQITERLVLDGALRSRPGALKA